MVCAMAGFATAGPPFIEHVTRERGGPALASRTGPTLDCAKVMRQFIPFLFRWGLRGELVGVVPEG